MEQPVGNIEQQRIYLIYSASEEANALASEIRHHGYKTRVFVNLDVFSNAAKSAPPHLLIIHMDLLNEADDVLQALVTLSEQEGQDIPVIFVSRSGAIQNRLHAVQAGGVSFFEEPVNLMALLHRVRAILEKQTSAAINALFIAEPSDAINALVDGLEQQGIATRRINELDSILESLIDAPDIIILQGDAKDSDPFEITRCIRQEEAYFAIPVIVMTAKDKRGLDEDAAGSGVDSIVGIPVDPKDFVGIIRARVQRARSLTEEYRYLGKRDAQTGLYNRDYFVEKLTQTLALSGNSTCVGSLIFIQLPHDQASKNREQLIRLANILREKVAPPHIAARFDKNGFAILSFHQDERVLEAETQSIKNAFRKMLKDFGDENSAIDIGMCLIGHHIKSTDEALRRARSAIRPDVSVVNASAEESVSDSNEWNTEWQAKISNALSHNRFRLVYQPIANLSGQACQFHEVFVRMVDEAGGDILPNEFLPHIQRDNKENQLDRWIIQQAVHVLDEQSSEDNSPTLFIKLFPASIMDATMIDFIKESINEFHVAPERLVFQMTQTAVANRLSETAELIKGLKTLGCRTCIEHYDEQDSNHELLDKLPVDFVKIAGNLINDIMANPYHERAVQAITGKARAIDAATIAALVQDASALAVLYRCGVEYIQGFFMQEPSDVFGQR